MASRAPMAGGAHMVERFGKPVAGSIPTIVRSYKSSVTKLVHENLHSQGAPVWQRNYYEHVIRDGKDYERISGYILANPGNWLKDMEYFSIG